MKTNLIQGLSQVGFVIGTTIIAYYTVKALKKVDELIEYTSK